MKLTFMREKFFNYLGFRSIGSQDYIPNIDINNIKGSLTINSEDIRKDKVYRKKFIIFKTWRWWMQNIINKFLPYKKYRISQTITFNEDLIKKNRKLISRINDEKSSLQI